MESKKINQLATNVNPQTSDLTTIGDPITGQLKKITWLQVAHLIGAQAAVTLQQVTDNGNTTTDPITTGGLTLTNLNTGVPRLTSGEFVGTYGYGLANGVATLDSGGKIPASQLPSSVMEYKGTWNASTNTPTLADGTGDNGDVYLVNVAGSQNLGSGTISFAVGDWVVYNGTIWQKSVNSNAVASVFGRTGTIVAQEGDYTINQLGDVAITTPATNDYLRYNGSGWVNTQFPSFVSSDKLVLQVRNNSGATINKGTVVYINGATGGYPTIAKAQADADNTSAQTLGLVQDNISNNSNGVVVIVGQITGIDTSAYPAGTQLYLSGTTAGAFTSTKVLAPTHLVYVGIVTAQNAVNGVIEVKIQNGYELDEIHDVAISSVANNQGLFYESSTSLWKNKSIATVLGYTPEQPLTFSSPLVRTTNTISIPAATGSVNGYLTSTDWTTFNNKLSAAITSLNGLTAATQTFATGSSGTDFNISSSTSTHTFNIPSASASNRGLVTTGTQTFAGDKTFSGSLNGLTAVFTGSVTTPAGFYIDLNTYLYEGILQLTDLVNKKNILKFTASTSGHYINSLFLTGGSQQPIYISAKSTAGQNVIFNTDGTTTFSHAISGTTAAFTSNSGNFNLGSQTDTAIYTHFGSKSASGGQAVAMRLAGTLTATANFDNLFGLWVDYTDNTAGYAGVTRYGIYQNDSAKRNYFGGPTTFNSAVTGSDTITATAFIPTGTSVPSRGMYTSASNVLDFSAGTTNLLSLNYNTGLSTFNTGVRGYYFRIVNVSTAEFGINTENNQGYIGTTTSHGFNIMTNNTPRLTISSTGAATFSSSVKATQFQLSAASGQYYYFDNASGNNFLGLTATNTLGLYVGGNLSLSVSSTGAATFSGNVGIGGGTPSIFTAYSVASFGSLSTTNNGITIASTTAGNGLIEFADGTVSNQAYRGYIQYSHSADAMYFAAANNVALTLASTGAATFSGRVTAGSSMLLGEIQSSYSLVETTAGNGIWLRPAGIGSPNGLFVNTSGNVGIGIDTPTGNANRFLHVNGTDSSELHLTRSNSGTSSSFGGYITFDGSNNFNMQNRTGGDIIFTTTTSERMRITSGGVIQNIGGVYDTGSSTTHWIARVRGNDRIIADTTGYVYMPFLTSGSGIDDLGWWGSSGTSWTYNGMLMRISSSQRYKKNIRDLEIDTTKIFDLRTISFENNELTATDGLTSFGLLAEDVAEKIPILATYNNEGLPEGVQYKMLSVLLLEEMKKLKLELDTLKNK